MARQYVYAIVGAVFLAGCSGASPEEPDAVEAMEAESSGTADADEAVSETDQTNDASDGAEASTDETAQADTEPPDGDDQSPAPATAEAASTAAPKSASSEYDVYDLDFDRDAQQAAGQAGSCLAEEGRKVAENLSRLCYSVSSATRPRCHMANPCDMIIKDIQQGCARLEPNAPEGCSIGL